MSGLLRGGGGGQRVCLPPSKIIGGGRGAGHLSHPPPIKLSLSAQQ